MCKKKIRYVLLENPVIEMGSNDYLKQLVFFKYKNNHHGPFDQVSPKIRKR